MGLLFFGLDGSMDVGDSSCAMSEQGYEEEEPFREMEKSPVREM